MVMLYRSTALPLYCSTAFDDQHMTIFMWQWSRWRGAGGGRAGGGGVVDRGGAVERWWCRRNLEIKMLRNVGGDKEYKR
ncbi:hypothetical protein Tco_0401621 [Tanacetum coccineum]